MSISKEITVWCDNESCGEWEQESNTAQGLRKKLRKAGWLVNQPGGKDYCPKCKESHDLQHM